jgi:hypothetical protein
MPGVVPTRQTSSSGRPKSPRIQVVLPEDLCLRLSLLAEDESRTVSNMAKVLIQQGIERLERQRDAPPACPAPSPSPPGAAAAPAGLAAPLAGSTAGFRAALERHESEGPRRLRGIPRRLRLRSFRG